MAGKKQEAEQMTLEVIRTYNKETTPRGSDVFLRTVAWVKGTKRYPQFAKHESYSNANGEERTKTKGLNLADLAIMQQNWGSIMRDLGSKLPEHKDAAPTAEQQQAPESAPMASGPASDF